MRIDILSFIFLIGLLIFPAAAEENLDPSQIVIVDMKIADIELPDVNTGGYTQYWYSNTTSTDFNVFGFAYSLILPFTNVLGIWFYVIVWSAIIYRSYAKTQNVMMPVTLGILTAGVWGVFVPAEAQMIMIVAFAIGIASVSIKYFIER